MSETALRCARCAVYVADEAADTLTSRDGALVCVNVGTCDDRVARRQFLLEISPRRSVSAARVPPALP